MAANFDLKGFLNDPQSQADKAGAVKFLQDKGIIDAQGNTIPGTFKDTTKAQAPGFIKSVATDIAKPILQTGTSIYNAGAGLLKGASAIGHQLGGVNSGQELQQAGQEFTKSRNIPYFGETKPIQGIKGAVSTGLQLGALTAPGIGEVKGVVPFLKAAVTTGTAFGLPSGVGQALDADSPTIGSVVTGGIEGTVGGILATLGIEGATRGVSSILRSASENSGRVVNSLIKPLLKDLSYGKNPGKGIVDEGIIATSLEDLANKISIGRQDSGQKIGAAIKDVKTKIDASAALQPIQDAITQAKNNPRTNAGIIDRLQNIWDDLMKVKTTPEEVTPATPKTLGSPLGASSAGENVLNLKKPSGGPTVTDVFGKKVVTPAEDVPTRNLKNVLATAVFNFKQDLVDLTKFTGNPSDDKFVNMALKKAYGNLKELLNKVVPGLEKENERYANLSSAEIATRYRDKIETRQNLVNIRDLFSSIGGVLAAFISGNPVAALVGIGTAGVDQALSSTIGKTAIAQLLNKLPQDLQFQLVRAYPALTTLIVKSAVKATGIGGPTGQ